VRAGERRNADADQERAALMTLAGEAHRALKEFKKAKAEVERLSETPWLGYWPPRLARPPPRCWSRMWVTLATFRAPART